MLNRYVPSCNNIRENIYSMYIPQLPPEIFRATTPRLAIWN